MNTNNKIYYASMVIWGSLFAIAFTQQFPTNTILFFSSFPFTIIAFYVARKDRLQREGKWGR